MMQTRKRRFPNSQVYCFHPGTPPKSSTEAEGQKAVSAGKENEMPVRKKMRTDSFEKQSSVQQDQNSASFTESNTEDEIKRSSLAGQKRKSSPATSLNDNHEEREMPVRKKKRMTNISSANQLSSKSLKCSDPTSDVCHLKVHHRQVQSAPAEVHFSPVSSRESLDSTTDLKKKGDILSRYKMGRLLGVGGYGEVYEGTRLEDGLKVAVKIAIKTANIKYISIPGHVQPLPLEVGLLIMANAKPKAPEIIELLDWQDRPERYIMILECPSPCQDLHEYMKAHGATVDEDTARSLLVQITKAADACCLRGVFHRDIKLENLLINTDTLQVKLIDFGCGDLLDESGYERYAGTRVYCPPEYFTQPIYHAKPATVWSLGVLLFRLVCGKFPQSSELSLIKDGDWCRPDLSKECCDLIRALLCHSPTDRMNLKNIIFHEWFTVTE